MRDPYGGIARRFAAYDTILEPDHDLPEWWAGAPSVTRGPDGVFWMACRMRMADAPRGLRGYEIRMLRGEDGVQFETVLRISREAAGVRGFERPCLRYDALSGRFQLWGCSPDAAGRWRIVRFADAATPAEFDPSSARPVLAASGGGGDAPEGYKDPVIRCIDGVYHAYVIGCLRERERTYHFTSADGMTWRSAGGAARPILELCGWHDYFVRPAALLSLGAGYLFVYEGSNSGWHDPVYNVATGLGFTFDLHEVHDLTPEAPILRSTTPGGGMHTWRYSDWLFVDGELWAYAETARPNLTNEIRLFRVPLEEVPGAFKA